MRDPHTLYMLQQAVKGSSNTAVAAEIGVSRTAISLYLNDKYGADEAGLEAKIRARYDSYSCPHFGEAISAVECQVRAKSVKPFGGRAKLAHWNACQCCDRNVNRREA